MPLARKKLVEGLEYFSINFRTQLLFQRFLCLRVVDFRILNHVPVGDEIAVVPEQEAAAGGRQVRISELDGLPSEIRLNLHGDQDQNDGWFELQRALFLWRELRPTHRRNRERSNQRN